MASQLFRPVQVLKRCPGLNVAAIRFGSSHSSEPLDFEAAKIGNRAIVGYGLNGMPNYIDQVDFPAPAIRFRPDDAPGVKALREKEKDDWHKLTKEEKKALYRASFCQTLAEVEAPTGYWKSIVGGCFFSVGVAFWIMLFMKTYVYDPLPSSLSLEARQAQLQRMLDAEVDIIDGLSSHYDYEKETWKQ